jgi:signal peptidase I
MRNGLVSFWETVRTVVLSVIAVLLVRTFVAQPFLVSGASMDPTFKDGDYLLVDELSYRAREPERGEVVVFRYPGDHRFHYIKRIIGLPGEKIISKDGELSVWSAENKKVLTEKYLKEQTLKDTGEFEVTLAEDQYFVMGDNRGFSYDSRSWGPLSSEEITGLVRFRLWPIQTAEVFAAPQY